MDRLRLSGVALALSLVATSLHAQSDPNSQFVEALGRFSLLLDGRYGDEGADILASLTALDRGVARWDEAIQSLQVEAARNPPSEPKLAALMHVGLSGLYFDRLRLADARRELDAAAALDDGRPDTFVLRGLAASALGDA